MELIADNYRDDQSSCYFLDLRNSTYITRTISLHGDHKKSDYSARLKHHAEFMLSVHRFLISKLEELKITEYYYNDTGDGHLCLFWGKNHAATALKIACTVAVFLRKELLKYNKVELSQWSKEIGIDLSLDFGIGLHTGGSLIYKQHELNRTFAFGIAVNSAARVESYTKNFIDLPILLTKNFVYYLQSHLLPWNNYSKFIKQVTKYHVDIKDSRKDGHLLYTILENNWMHFAIQP